MGRAAELTLSVTDTEVRLRGAGLEVSGLHAGRDRRWLMRCGACGRAGSSWRACAARTWPTTPAVGGACDAGGGGAAAGGGVLAGPVAAALGEVIADAERRWAPVRLGIDVPGELRALPWEALAVPGRDAAGAASTAGRLPPQAADEVPVPSVAGPLRIVVAISAPLSGGGGVLDYERELRNMLAAVRGARQGPARVQIVHFATTAEIRAALAAEPAHVLHLSGHGQPGAIELEDDEGNARVLDARQFVAEAIPPGRMPPVIALSACYTDAAATEDSVFRRGSHRAGRGGGDRHRDRRHRRVRHPGVRPDLRRTGRCSAPERSPPSLRPGAPSSSSSPIHPTPATSNWPGWASGRC